MRQTEFWLIVIWATLLFMSVQLYQYKRILLQVVQ